MTMAPTLWKITKKKIDLTLELIQKHGKAVICCVAGISSSNAIALGVLVKYFNMAFYEAHELIGKRVPIANINQSHISKLKTLLNVTIP
jgi:protein-tyrosine phosphatase